MQDILALVVMEDPNPAPKQPRAQLWTAVWGQGVPLLLLSGGPGCCDYIGPVAALVEDLAQVYRLEEPGCGRSAPAQTYTLAQSLSAIENLSSICHLAQYVGAGMALNAAA
jgi:proline iminopeptidase